MLAPSLENKSSKARVPSKKKKGRFIKRAEKEKLKRRLVEEAHVELSSTGSELDSAISYGIDKGYADGAGKKEQSQKVLRVWIRAWENRLPEW